MKLIHSADWHLSSQRSKLDPKTGLNARLLDFAGCAAFTIEDGLARDGQAVIHSGDVFNSPRPSPTEVFLFRQAIGQAQARKVPVIVLLGNHDSLRSPAERNALDLLRQTPGVTVADLPQVLGLQFLETEQGAFSRLVEPESPQAELLLACVPWPNKQLLLTDEESRKLSPGELNQAVRERMMHVIGALGTARREGIPFLLAGHFGVDTAQAGGQNRLMMLGGEWTLNIHDLEQAGFDAMLLGHIHKPQELAPAISYCGSPEAVSFGEEGEEKSYSLWTIESGASTQGAHSITFERIQTPFRHFVTLGHADLTEEGDLADPESLAGAVVRLRLPETSSVDRTDLRRQLEAAGVHDCQIEVQRVESTERRETAVTAEMDPEVALRTWLETKPELAPLMEPILAEARAVESALQGGEA